jgi:PadR family transcriptional regulator, regulatory protein PadR
LYPLLTRLKNAGLVEYKWVESLSGPPRKYYVLTQVGKQFLDELQTTWDELVASTQHITLRATNGSSAKKFEETTSATNTNATNSPNDLSQTFDSSNLEQP